MEIKIAYIGGGSRGWAWGLMSDLAATEDLSGSVYLYDIDYEAAKANEVIGNKYSDRWTYKAVETAGEALTGANFVIISILPGTFDEMESDVHTPEKYGIWQPVGDSTGPGGIVRAMRTVPMFEVIAENIKKYAPDAWVINYTNPMTLCVKTLYRVFPEIKAFGCCHEVFKTQNFLASIVEEEFGEKPERDDIKINPVSVNHFTWLTSARWKNIDLFPVYKKYCQKRMAELTKESMEFDDSIQTREMVKMDLFNRYGWIAAAGDRHLVEFCPGKWYLESPERVKEMGFELTTVAWRKEDLVTRLEKSKKLLTGEIEVEQKTTGEEGVHQMKALLGMGDMITNVNIPNRGQIPNLPLGAVVETNAVFRSGEVVPVMAGEIPKEIYPLISRICGEQEALDRAIASRDVDAVFQQFANDPLVTCNYADAKKLFVEMCEKTKDYLKDYDLSFSSEE